MQRRMWYAPHPMHGLGYKPRIPQMIALFIALPFQDTVHKDTYAGVTADIKWPQARFQFSLVLSNPMTLAPCGKESDRKSNNDNCIYTQGMARACFIICVCESAKIKSHVLFKGI